MDEAVIALGSGLTDLLEAVEGKKKAEIERKRARITDLVLDGKHQPRFRDPALEMRRRKG